MRIPPLGKCAFRRHPDAGTSPEAGLPGRHRRDDRQRPAAGPDPRRHLVSVGAVPARSSRTPTSASSFQPSLPPPAATRRDIMRSALSSAVERDHQANRHAPRAADPEAAPGWLPKRLRATAKAACRRNQGDPWRPLQGVRRGGRLRERRLEVDRRDPAAPSGLLRWLTRARRAAVPSRRSRSRAGLRGPWIATANCWRQGHRGPTRPGCSCSDPRASAEAGSMTGVSRSGGRRWKARLGAHHGIRWPTVFARSVCSPGFFSSA